MIELKPALEAQIRLQAEESYPHECCGILIGAANNGWKRVTAVASAENQRTDSLRNRFLIDPRLLYETERRLRGSGEEVLGFFHSHPEVPARPSEYDREHAWPWYSYIIVSVLGGNSRELTCWTLREDRSAFDPEEIRSCKILET